MFGAFVFVPGIGHVAAGGYLLFMLIAAGLGATGGALGGALTSTGIPKDGIPVYESDLPAEPYLVIAHGTPGDAYHARTMLAQTTHERLDHHETTSRTASPAGG